MNLLRGFFLNFYFSPCLLITAPLLQFLAHRTLCSIGAGCANCTQEGLSASLDALGINFLIKVTPVTLSGSFTKC